MGFVALSLCPYMTMVGTPSGMGMIHTTNMTRFLSL